MSLLSRKRIVLAKIESTYGTDPTPAGANALVVTNLNFTPQEADYADRDVVRPYLGNSESLTAAVRTMIDFEVEIQGSGTAGTAPAYDCLLRSCGFSATTDAGVSVTYTPESASLESSTIYFNVDGVLHKMTGCRGTMSLGLTAKQIPRYKFTFTGLYSAVTDTSAVSPVYSGFKTPLPVTNLNTGALTLHGATPVMSELTIDMANSIVHRTLVGGSEQVLLTDRKPTGSVTIEAGTVAAKDWFTAVKNSTLGGLDITHGTVSGYKVQISAPNVQLTQPTYSDMDGVQMLQMNMNLIPGSSGNDELTIVVL